MYSGGKSPEHLYSSKSTVTLLKYYSVTTQITGVKNSYVKVQSLQNYSYKLSCISMWKNRVFSSSLATETLSVWPPQVCEQHQISEAVVTLRYMHVV